MQQDGSVLIGFLWLVMRQMAGSPDHDNEYLDSEKCR
jgi:hypothetical protein